MVLVGNYRKLGISRQGIYNRKYIRFGKASPSISNVSAGLDSTTKLPTQVPKHSYSCLQVVAPMLKIRLCQATKRVWVHLPFSRSLSMYISISTYKQYQFLPLPQLEQIGILFRANQPGAIFEILGGERPFGGEVQQKNSWMIC